PAGIFRGGSFAVGEIQDGPQGGGSQIGGRFGGRLERRSTRELRVRQAVSHCDEETRGEASVLRDVGGQRRAAAEVLGPSAVRRCASESPVVVSARGRRQVYFVRHADGPPYVWTYAARER